MANDAVKAYAVFLASFGEEAERIRRELPAGRGFVCFDSAELPVLFREIFTAHTSGG